MVEYNMAVVSNKNNEKIIVDEIIDYVKNRNYGEEVSEDGFVFGSIAISINGEDKVDIGSKLILGDNYKCDESLKSQLEEVNRRFGQALNNKSCYSITKYLKINKLKCFSLQLDDEPSLLSLYLFDQIKPKTIKCENGLFDFSNSIYAPKYVDDYRAPVINGKLCDALDAFNITLGYYNSFHHLVRGEADEGYIYLIRPSNSDAVFTALAYVYLKLPLDGKDIEIISQKLGNIYLGILKNKARKEAIKSAKAAIMSRNISHNLGSHVMAYMKHDLSSVEDMLKNGVLKNALPCKEVPMENKEIPYLVGIGKFLSYLQERQDYIATVSTDYIPYPSIVNFKDAIYDELNPDYRFQRHSEWKGHKPANILLENIAKSEGFSRKTLSEDDPPQRSNNIIIKYKKFDGQKPSSEEQREDYDKLRQWNFSLPGGIMGRQAVFSIVENVIRNAAKHGSKAAGDNLVLTFDIIDPMMDSLNDNDAFWKQYKNVDNLYIITLTDNNITDPKRVQDINKILHAPFSTDGDDLTTSNKGLKEMLISAAWLRSIHIEENEGKEQVDIMSARNTEEGFLQYVFCLPKVKEVAMITEKLSVKDEIIQLLKKHGWYFYFSVDDYLACQNKDFCFVIIDPKNEDAPNDLKRIKECSNNRCFVARNERTCLKDHIIKTDLFEKLSEKFSELMGNNPDKTSKIVKEEIEQLLMTLTIGLYKELAGVEDFKIAICDSEFRNTLSTKQKEKISKMVDVLDDNGNGNIGKFSYIFRKHNDTEGQFRGFLDTYGNIRLLKFVEGITGGNSTDRLVRHSDLDDLWAYKQIHSMSTKVAIFDERIFAKVTGYEMVDLVVSDAGWNFIDISVEEAKNAIWDYSEKKEIDIDYNTWEKLETIEETVEFANTYCPLEKRMHLEMKADSINALIFQKKGIDVYTMTWENGGTFNIWGYVPEESLPSSYGKIMKVGSLIVDPKGQEAPVLDMEKHEYNYLSIHQGLLDKVYDKANIKGDSKKKVTKKLYERLVDCPECGEEDYLQGLIIHSGRSKPNRENMPQKQPFVQYSAIENAVFDCKYTLVELLDFACCESYDE